MAFRSDTHNKKYDPLQRSGETIIVDVSGGLNLVDNPYALAQNQLVEATNFQYAPEGGAIETRDGLIGHTQCANGGTYDPPLKSEVVLLYPVDGVIYFSAAGNVYSSVAELVPFAVALYQCSDFSWMNLGPYRCDELEYMCSEFDNTLAGIAVIAAESTLAAVGTWSAS